jgi:MFS superfamily sulfate permease-like transporter
LLFSFFVRFGNIRIFELLQTFFSTVAATLASAILAGSVVSPVWALRDVVSNQPDIPDVVVAGRTVLSTSGRTDIKNAPDAFTMDINGNKV